jgi:hypothetical protein
MKPILVLTVLAGLAALYFVLRTPQPATVGAPAVDAADQALLSALSEEFRALRAELQALRAEQASLGLRVTEIESRPAALAVREPVGGPSSEEVAQAMEMVAAIQHPDSTASPGLETFVLDVLGEKEERERAEREERRLAALTDVLHERVQELSGELGLSSYQEQELFGVLSAEATRRDAFFEELRESGSWDRRTMRDTMGKLREETLTALQTVLTPEQLERYRELEDRPPFFGGGFGNGRGRPDDENARNDGGR